MSSFFITTGNRDGYWNTNGVFSNISPSYSLFSGFGVLFHIFSIYDTTIRQGSKIVLANLSYISQGNYSGGVISRIYGVKSPYPDIPINSNDCNIAQLTSSFVNWTTGTWTTNNKFISPDISSVIQELVNQEGFSGRIYIQHKSISGIGIVNQTTAYSFETSPNLSPILTINYVYKGKIQINDELSPDNVLTSSEVIGDTITIGDIPIKP